MKGKSDIKLTVKKMTGDRPFFWRPEAQFVDEQNEELIFYWSDTDEKFRISVCSLKTWRWTEKTKRFSLIQRPGSPLSKEVKKPLPIHRCTAGTLCILAEHRVLLLFGGLDRAEVPTSNFYVIDIDTYKWWQVETPEDILPRVGATMTFVNNLLYIFGGQHEASNTFSVVQFDPAKLTWGWTIRDRPYPSNVPLMGYAGDVIPLYDGKKFLLLPGYIQEDSDEVSLRRQRIDLFLNWLSKIDMSASQTIIFDPFQYTFQVCDSAINGEFPSKMAGYDIAIVSSRRLLQEGISVKHEENKDTAAPVVNSILITEWSTFTPSTGTRALPEMWILGLSESPNNSSVSRCLRLRDKFKELNMSLMSCAVLTDRRIILLGSNAPVDEEENFNTCVEIEV
ncbi:hypothetical protein H0H81_006521 [Sphagnurus paluster]|uniref:Uncharacterized protein n=1 Tax=Sphagnurus paluster TaxID=117069 RepID=A0A9P7GR97_9AGAR|nr:hypothetical protein H0H81_006521 [Sphagnurus paluster]